MAAFLPNFSHQYLKSNPIQSSNSIISNPNNIRFQTSLTKSKISTIFSRYYTFSSASLIQPLVAPEDNNNNSYNGRKPNSLSNSENLVDYIPGGSWWNLEDDNNEAGEVKSNATNRITVWYVVRRIWGLVEDDKLVVYIGFGSLAFAALAEISIPTLLTASIFAAQNGETLVFYKNLKLLTFLCFVSGICSGLRGGCFAIANMVLLKRLRETLYANLLFQDVSFFDRESVGDLTSRLGVDCQKLSHIIGNNLHLIARNSLQGTGALINLLTLSWPLALSACFICTLLCMIFLVYGRYQKKAATLIQDFTARANEVSEETLSLVRTVRVSGMETKEHERYKQWLNKLAITSMRESAAYGLWNLSFNTLYRSTQVFAIVLGGMSILTGDASAEQLTKYVLYCEWLIYAAWRLADNFSSLLQAVGASEKE